MASAVAAKLLLELLVVTAAFLDLRSRRIPNRLTASGVVAGLSINTYQSGWAGLKTGLAGLGLALLLYGLLFAIRAMGGGDVKLMAAVGAFTGPQPWLSIFAITAVVGGVLAVVTLLARGGLVRALSNVATIMGSLFHFRAPHQNHPELDVAHASARTLPHGAAIAIGVLIYFVWLAPR